MSVRKVKGRSSSGYLQFQDLSGNYLAGFNANGFQVAKLPVVAKTASYSVTAAESGTLFTTTGATGAVTFTLPTKAAGLHFYFYNTADQDMIVAPDAVDTMVAFNDAEADSVATSTASEQFGGAFHVVCDGTKWLAMNVSAGANTVTVAT